MKVQSPPGMRDFYPEDMRLQNWLLDKWRAASLSFGFAEYEAPIFEYLDLYRLKSGAGIVSELFSFEDRGGRAFAIRPEMTPSLARMVAARANALPRPLKWFSLPRMCRAEKPQRGRLREFFQWNADVLGVDDPLADAEIIAVAIAFFRAVGLSADDVVIRISNRPVATAALHSLGVPAERAESAFQLIDRHDRMSAEEFAKAWESEFGGQLSADRLTAYLREASMEASLELARQAGEQGAAQADRLESLWQRLSDLGVATYCEFDVGIVRGLPYYTGTVFEGHARKPGLRALFGGGRYDDLTAMLDGPRMPGVGFGMGDVPVLECLRELGKLPTLEPALDVFVIDADAELFAKALEIVTRLRAAGLSVDYSYKRAGVGKQFKQAAGRNARFAVVVGRELVEKSQLSVKNMESGEQVLVDVEQLPEYLRRALHVQSA